MFRARCQICVYQRIAIPVSAADESCILHSLQLFWMLVSCIYPLLPLEKATNPSPLKGSSKSFKLSHRAFLCPFLTQGWNFKRSQEGPSEPT